MTTEEFQELFEQQAGQLDVSNATMWPSPPPNPSPTVGVSPRPTPVAGRHKPTSVLPNSHALESMGDLNVYELSY